MKMLDAIKSKLEPIGWIASILGFAIGAFFGWWLTASLAETTLRASRVGGFAGYVLVIGILAASFGYMKNQKRSGALVGAIAGIVWSALWIYLLVSMMRTVGFLVLGGTGILFLSIAGGTIFWSVANAVIDGVMTMLAAVQIDAARQATGAAEAKVAEGVAALEKKIGEKLQQTNSDIGLLDRRVGRLQQDLVTRLEKLETELGAQVPNP